MSIQIQGNGGVVAEVDGTTYRALRVTIRPVDYGALGQYRISMLTGTMAAGLAAASEIFQSRWTAASNLALIWGVNLDGMSGSATTFTAGFSSFTLTIARSWSGDGSGGSAATLTGNNQKLRTSMATTSMGTIRMATTAALGAGTKTLDSQTEGQVAFSLGTTASVNYVTSACLYGAASLEDGGNPSPIVLAQNEGVVVRATVPASGTWQGGVTMAWTEVASY
jgi:hypothetical protein